MNDDTRAQQTPVNDTQDAPMPSAEQQTAQPSDAERAGQVTEEAASAQPEGEALPENASDRTRREFEKLRNELREEKTRRELIERSFQSMQPKQEEVAPQIAPIYDPETGLLNEQVLTDVQQRALAAERRAAKAEQSIEQFYQERENQETFAAFPELNPNDKKVFNKDLHVATRQVMLDSMLNPQDYGNKQLSFKEAATLAKSRLPGSLEAAKKEGAQQAMEQLTPKEQASLDAVGSPARRGQVESDLDDLRRRTRKGDPNASIERMKRILGQG